MAARGPAAHHTGFFKNAATGKLDFYYDGTRIGGATASTFDVAASYASTTTITAGTGVTATTGNITNTAGDSRITAGNLRLGAVTAFATTEPTSAVVLKEGTNPVGAVATSGGFFTTTAGATISKIIAAGTVSQIEA